MIYQFMAELIRSLGGRIREIRLDGLVAGAYAATVEAEGPHGVELVDARSSDALNLAVLVGAPIVVVLEMLEDSDRRQEGDPAEAVLMRRALAACPMTINRAEQHRTAIALGGPGLLRSSSGGCLRRFQLAPGRECRPPRRPREAGRRRRRAPRRGQGGVTIRPGPGAAGLGQLGLAGSGGEVARHQRDALPPGRELVRGQVGGP